MQVRIATTKRSDFTKAVRVFSDALLERAPNVKGALVVSLNGELGAGKTTFVQEFARTLGARGRVLSPTFIVTRSHELTNGPWDILHHVDVYRFESTAELDPIGWKEMVSDPRAVMCVEWGSKIKAELPKKRIDILIDGGEKPAHRKLTFNFYGL